MLFKCERKERKALPDGIGSESVDVDGGADEIEA